MDARSPILITPPGRVDLGLRQVWAHRSLLWFLTWRDVKIRYRQTVVGGGWAILQPFLLMLVFTFFLGFRAGIPSDGLPYPLFYFSGLVPWLYFANSLNRSAASVVRQHHIIKKVYFPRLILPTYAVLPSLIDFSMGFVVLVGLVLWEGLTPSPQIWVVLPLMGLSLLAALGGGLWLSAVNALYRDVQEAIPVIIRFGLFASPVIYPVSIVPEGVRWVYGLNPMAVVINRLRWSLVNQPGADPVLLPLAPALAVVGVAVVTGVFFFRRLEDRMVDVV